MLLFCNPMLCRPFKATVECVSMSLTITANSRFGKKEPAAEVALILLHFINEFRRYFCSDSTVFSCLSEPLTQSHSRAL